MTARTVGELTDELVDAIRTHAFGLVAITGVLHGWKVPLPRTFAGVYDEQWDELPSDSGLAYGQVALGRNSWEWLRLDD